MSGNRVIDSFPCPDCKVKVNVARTERGDIILHPMPPCATFIRSSDEEYRALVKRGQPS